MSENFLRAQLNQEIELSIKMLKLYTKTKTPLETLPCFYYSARKLFEYAHLHQHNHQTVNLLFSSFYQEFSEFQERILPLMTQCQQISKKLKEKNIISDIKGMITSQKFLKYINPRDKVAPYLFSEKNSGNIIDSQLKIGSNQSTQALSKHQASTSSLIKFSPIHQEIQVNQKTSQKQKWICQYKECLRYDEEHIIDKAHSKALELFSQLETSDFGTSSFTTEKRKLNQVIGKYNQMISYYNHFEEQKWELDKVDNGVSLHYRMYEEQKLISVLIQSEIEVPLNNFMPMICEVDYFDKYVPLCYDCRLVKKLSRNEVIGHSKVQIPMLSDRQVYFYAVGYDRVEKNGSFFFYSKSINNDREIQKKFNVQVPDNKKFVKMNYNFFIIQYTPLTPTRGRVKIASNVDLQMNYLPNWILSLAARKFAFLYFENIMKNQKGFQKSVWAQKLKSNPEFYEFFKQKLKLPSQ